MPTNFAQYLPGYTPQTGGASSLGGSILGALGGPWGMAATTGVGLVQGFLQGNAQRDLYNRYESRLREISSPGYLDKLTDRQHARNSAEYANIARGTQLAAQTGADATRARFARAGLTGVGERQGEAAQIQAFTEGRQTMSRLRLESARMAMEQRDAEMRALAGLMGTPYGDVSPTSAALAGAGSGLEAATNAAYANQLAGRGNR